MKLTEAEWAVMEVLWSGENFSLGEITSSLHNVNSWNKNTVHTYLTRMEKKGYVKIHKGDTRPYSANISREECAGEERNELLSKVYKGATGDLIAAFLKESKISQKEILKLKKMLDEMEV
ncbi:MAG: BlaI/MecI/CopY family transcriptional regulator [Anaerofustis stercorihominis]|nr:BlaI/MecI/CopY family transcriptional regulator [Anaerofustis stercorihominis]